MFNPETVNKKFTPPGKSKIIQGTIISPQSSDLKLVLAVCSLNGKPDSELYKLFDRKWKIASAELKGWHQHHVDFKLGNVKTISVQSDVWISNALCLSAEGVLDEVALAKCIKKIGEVAKYEKGSVHVSSLLTTAIPQLPALLMEYCIENGVSVSLYEEPVVAAR